MRIRGPSQATAPDPLANPGSGRAINRPLSATREQGTYMENLQAPRFRLLGWLAVLAMIALAVLGPSASSVAAAAPTACNGMFNGADGSGVTIVQTATGVTVSWSLSGDATVVRACVYDSSGTAIGGAESKPPSSNPTSYTWADLGLEANPCLTDSTSFRAGLDITGVANTVKSAFATCSVQPSTEPSVAPSPSTPASTEPSVAPSPSTPASTEPSVAPSPSIPPSPEGSVLASTAVNSPSPAQSAGAVLGATGTPRVTLPPTDTSVGSTPSSGNWRILLVALAGVLAGVLVLTPTARRRS